MSRIEDRLTEALTKEADARNVASQALLVAMRERLPVRRKRGRTPLLLVASAAAGVVAVAGVGFGNNPFEDEDRVATELAVEAEFACPEQVEVDVSGTQDAFLPDLADASPQEVAEYYDAPRWRFDETGDEARLYLGNSDGTLGSITTYVRAQDGAGWALAQAVACGNGSPAAPTSDALRLGVHDSVPHPPDNALATGERGLDPVLVDDRSVYDYSGLVTRHRSLYVAPCGTHYCWVSGLPTSVIMTRSPIDSGAERAGLRDLSDIFFLADDMVDRDQPFVFLAIPDQRGATAFRAITASATYQGARLAHPSWGERAVWVVLLPSGNESVRAELLADDQVLSSQDIELAND